MAHDTPYHNRHSLRLPGYDYASPGAYFVTVCVQKRLCLFGTVQSEHMELSPAGRMVHRWLQELPRKFSCLDLDASVVMPNHVHALLMIHDTDTPGGSTSLFRVINWFKTMSTNSYIQGVRDQGWSSFPSKLWQRGYHEHIVRDNAELLAYREYIDLNPVQWSMDHENPEATAR